MAKESPSIYIIDPTDATTTFACEFPDGESGNAMTFNSDDGKFYRAADTLFERINDFSVDPCDTTLISSGFSETSSIVFLGSGSFLAQDTSFPTGFNKILGIDGSIGTIPEFSNLHPSKGLAFVGALSGPALAAKADIITDLNLLKDSTDDKTDKKIDKVIKHIDKSTNDKFWEDDGESLDPKKGKKVFDQEKKAVKGLKKLLKKADGDLTVAISLVIDLLIDIDRNLARDAIDVVPDGTGIEKVDKEIEKAEKELLKDKPKPDKAIEHFKKAWEHAQKALKLVP